MLEALFVAVGALLGASVTGVFSWLSNRGKVKVDATETVVQAALALVKPLQDRIDLLETRVRALEHENAQLRAQLSAY